MAIYHLSAKIGSNEKEHKALSKCSYITRTGDYSKKSEDCAYTASGNMPKWPKVNPQKDASHYWKAADTYERENGRLYRELEFALPRELSLDQQKVLAHAFSEQVSTLKDGRKLPFTFAIHTDKKGHNPHCHLMISERVNDGIPRNASTWFKRANSKEPKKGGAIKTQELRGKQWLEPVRELWATMANDALRKAGCSAQIDHRSHETRKIDKAPTEHMGRASIQMMRRGAYCHRGPEILAKNIHTKTANRISKFNRTRIGFRSLNAKVATTAMEIMNATLNDLSRAWAVQREVAVRERELIQLMHDMNAQTAELRMVSLREMERNYANIFEDMYRTSTTMKVQQAQQTKEITPPLVEQFNERLKTWAPSSHQIPRAPKPPGFR